MFGRGDRAAGQDLDEAAVEGAGARILQPFADGSCHRRRRGGDIDGDAFQDFLLRIGDSSWVAVLGRNEWPETENLPALPGTVKFYSSNKYFRA